MLQKALIIKNTVVLTILAFRHIKCLHLMYAEVAWVPQVILDPDYLPDYLSVSYDYGWIYLLKKIPRRAKILISPVWPRRAKILISPVWKISLFELIQKYDVAKTSSKLFYHKKMELLEKTLKRNCKSHTPNWQTM